MTGEFDTDVLIVGAGPAGLGLACDLARRGVGRRIVDQQQTPLQASRGKGVQPRTLELFEDLGMLDAFLEVSAPYPVIRLMKGDTMIQERRLNEMIAPTSDIPYPNMIMAAQWRTDEVLRKAYGKLGGEVENGVALTAFEQTAQGVTAILERDGETSKVRARYLVGADGGRSLVRTSLGIDFPGETLESARMLEWRSGDIILISRMQLSRLH